MTISIRSETYNFGTGNASDQISINKPGSVQDGDYLVVVMGAGDDLPNLAPPGDWTTGDLNASSVGNDRQLGIFYKKITNAAGEPSTYTFTLGNGDVGSWWIGALSGIDPNTPEDEAMSGNAVTLSNDLTPAAPSITTANANSFVLAGWCTNYFNDASMPGGNWATRRQNQGTSPCNLCVASQTFASAGDTGAVEITSVTTGMETSCGQWAFRNYAITPTTVTLSVATTTASGVVLSISEGEVAKLLNVASSIAGGVNLTIDAPFPPLSINFVVGNITAIGVIATIDAPSGAVDIPLDTASVLSTGIILDVLPGEVTRLLNTGNVLSAGIKASLLLYQILNPVSDTSLGSWTDQDGGVTNIYMSIDESIPSDVDYVKSPVLPAANTYKFKLESIGDPNIHTHHSLDIRAKKPNDVGSLNLSIRLLEGSTVIATRQTSVGIDWVTFGFDLTEAEVDDITDYSNLYIELEAAEA